MEIADTQWHPDDMTHFLGMRRQRESDPLQPSAEGKNEDQQGTGLQIKPYVCVAEDVHLQGKCREDEFFW